MIATGYTPKYPAASVTGSKLAVGMTVVNFDGTPRAVVAQIDPVWNRNGRFAVMRRALSGELYDWRVGHRALVTVHVDDDGKPTTDGWLPPEAGGWYEIERNA